MALPESDVKVDALVREHDSHLYVFAVNYDERLRATTATVEIHGLKAGTRIEVVDENRTLTAADGHFSDHFDPLAVHIYRIPSGPGAAPSATSRSAAAASPSATSATSPTGSSGP